MVLSSNSAPFVSVLLPCSSDDYLDECINSILRQTFNDFEIVLVLNGVLRDKTAEFQRRYSHFAKKISIYSCSESGIVPALNLGISKSQGEIIARMDADDLMVPDRLSLQVKAFKGDVNLVAVGGQIIKMGPSGVIAHPRYPLTHKDTLYSLNRSTSLPHPGTSIRKESLKQIGGYRNRYPFVEDWDLWLRLSEIGLIYNIPEEVIIYKLHPNQTSSLKSTEQLQNASQMLKNRLKCLVKTNLGKKKISVKSLNQIRYACGGFLLAYSRSRENSSIWGKIPFLFIAALIDPLILFKGVNLRLKRAQKLFHKHV
jgi:glycosyltransferase involved in cell wall biosynthesis